ncbi:MAG: phosphate ABC transporter ATP-binding protein [Oscillospiraceae bacterium]|nr:phosphate ABC transporter ATP-binding protein [Oscillospiraceae bacterium]
MGRGELLIEVKNFNAWYAKNQALDNVSFEVPVNSIYAFIGPSGCGKTTMLRSLNRLNDLVGGFKCEGTVKIGGADIYARHDRKFVENLRKSIGMIFQQPNPLPITIMQNMLLPINEHYTASKTRLKEIAVENLTMAAIYDEVADKLDKPALSLSGGQQQRLCIARALILKPGLILFDEPCSALDPISTGKIEALLLELKNDHTIVMVTHNMEQARRVSDYTAFFYNGEIVESGETLRMFSMPETSLLDRYIRGII